MRDKLLAVGVIVDDEELLHIAIKGLPKEYNAFRSAIRTRSTQLGFDELSTMLNAEEESLNEGIEVKDSIFALATSTNQKPNSNGFNQNYNRGRGKGNFNNRGGRGGRGFSGQHSQFYSAAIDHIIASLHHLSFPKPYTTQDLFTVGNGQTLPIAHTGTTFIPSSSSNIQLNNVLRVPSIASNLASVHKLCHDNNC